RSFGGEMTGLIWNRCQCAVLYQMEWPGMGQHGQCRQAHQREYRQADPDFGYIMFHEHSPFCGSSKKATTTLGVRNPPMTEAVLSLPLHPRAIIAAVCLASHNPAVKFR